MGSTNTRVNTVLISSYYGFTDVDAGPSPAEDVMAAQQKPKPTHAIEEPLPPPPPSPQSSASQSVASPPPPCQTAQQHQSDSGKVLATPAVRKIAMDHNVRGVIPQFKISILLTNWFVSSIYKDDLLGI